MVVVLGLSTNPDGEITAIVIKKSSGDNDYDQSAIEAAKGANPLSELTGLPKDIYESLFSKFSLTFDPIDLQK